MKYYTIRFKQIKNNENKYGYLNILAKDFFKVIKFIIDNKFEEDYYKVENIDYVTLIDDVLIVE